VPLLAILAPVERTANKPPDQPGELVSGIVRRLEHGDIVLDLGGAEALLPVREQVPGETHRDGDRVVAYVVESAVGGPIVVSRAHRGLLEKLFEMEVPEIHDRLVSIEASARLPGARSKIAVRARDQSVDPVAACVGMKGSRVEAVLRELRGEKVDILPWDPDPARFACNAIAPAQVSRVIIDAASRTTQLVVPDDQLSLAIGKKGENVRLAAQLTGWNLEVLAMGKAETRRGGTSGGGQPN
jgi:transcription termination/antitermination protein NusA